MKATGILYRAGISAALLALFFTACGDGAGGADGDGNAAANYVSEYRAQTSCADEALALANEVNESIVEEGIVLMKNEGGALPLDAGSRITVLGKNSADPVYGGGGSASGADGSGQGGMMYSDLYGSLEKAGFALNPVMRAFYEDDSASGSGRDGGSGTGEVATVTGETPLSSYTAEVRASYNDYNDAAIVFLSRAGGEGADLMTNYTSPVAGRSDYNDDGDAASGDHYLETDDNEEALIAEAKANFDRVVVVLNVGTSFELGTLEDDEGIDAVLWLGFPGGNGMDALGSVLSGEVNPSGRTADIYSADFKADPTFANFGGNYASQYLTSSGRDTGVNFVEYDEGIYTGYRYYETRAFEEGGDWYEENVVYPFGYGLSYTRFEWDVAFRTDKLTADGGIVADVTVTNTGDMAGKDVVQLYYSAPYCEGEVEKAHVVLGAFAKTELIRPGMSDTVTLSLTARSMASYDYSDANGNGNRGYELDAGRYVMYVGKNSHAWAEDGASKTYSLGETVIYQEDGTTGAAVENRFGYMSDYFDADGTGIFAGNSSVMSRADFEGTFPKPVTGEQLRISEDERQAYIYEEVSEEYDEGKPWHTDEMPSQPQTTSGGISASELVGLDYGDPLWEKFMDNLSVEDMRDLIVDGYFVTGALEEVGLPMSVTPDGPAGFVQGSGYNWVGNTCFYASPIVVASTWNSALARAMGEAVGEEGIWGGEQGIQGGYNGWYAPGGNLHRSPFGGRNFEYYSEDPLLSGKMCAAVVAGAQSKGVFVMLKHFALNDQEGNRADLATWADEQTMREIYLKAFEIPVKEGGARGIMAAFNRMGNLWSGYSYELLTEVLREEWGFEGLVITDWANYNWFMDGNKMIRAGADLWLGNGEDGRAPGDIVGTESAVCTPTHVAAIRRAAKNIIYTVVNSNAMNRLGARYSAELYEEGRALDLGAFARGGSISFDASSSIYTGYEYVLYGGPKWISVDGATGRVSGKVAADAPAGVYAFVISLRDGGGFIGQSARVTFTVK